MAPEPVYKQIGKMIRARRRVLDKAQESLAQEVGMSRATLANIETGRQRILVHQLYAFAKTLNLKLSDLLPEQLPARLSAEWSGAPIEGDLNAEQKNQVVSLLKQGETPSTKLMEDGTDAKTSSRRTRSASSRTAR